MGCICSKNDGGEVVKDGDECGTSLRKIGWKMPEKMDGWGTRRPAEDAKLAEGVESLGDTQ